MYIPKNFLINDEQEIVDFIQRYSFATIISIDEQIPVATHLPFITSVRNGQLYLRAHFAKANLQWQNIKDQKVLIVFAEPHAYISPKYYDAELNVPTWNYVAVHVYGQVELLQEERQTLNVLEETIINYEPGYKSRWDSFDESYKLKMIKGIVAFEVKVTDVQGKKKVSQNRTEIEKTRIITALQQSEKSNERDVATYMIK